MKASFRSFTFVSKDSASEEEQDDDQEIEQNIVFEDPEFIVQSILKPFKNQISGKLRKKVKTASDEISEEAQRPLVPKIISEHELILQHRAQRFSEMKVKPPPSPHLAPKKLFSNSFLYPSFSEAIVRSIQHLVNEDELKKHKKKSHIPLKEIAYKITKPFEFDLKVFSNSNAPISILHSVKKLLFSNHIPFTAEDDNTLVFSPPLKLEDQEFHWMKVHDGFGFVCPPSPSNALLGCNVFGLGVTKEVKSQNGFDLRWLSDHKLSPYATLFSLLESESEKVDQSLRAKCNRLFMEDDESFTLRELNRIRRDLWVEKNNRIDPKQFAIQSMQFRGSNLLDFFVAEKCSPLFGAQLLKTQKQWSGLDLSRFQEMDWILADEIFDQEDSTFLGKIGNFLRRAKVSFTVSKGLLCLNSPLTIEGQEVSWIVPVHSLLLSEKQLELIRSLKGDGIVALVFAFGFWKDKVPDGLLPIDFRLLAVAE